MSRQAMQNPVEPIGYVADDGGDFTVFFRTKVELDAFVDEASPDRVYPVFSAAQSIPESTLKALHNILVEVMDNAVRNGANSISMPDEYVEVAAWLSGLPAPKLSQNDPVSI